MDEREISDLLDQLHAKLETGSELTESDRELLTRLSADLQALLARSGPLPSKHHRSLIERLEESITRFEVSHPDLTDLMARVSQKLDAMGI